MDTTRDFITPNSARYNSTVKKINSKFITSDVNTELERSAGERPSEAILPNRFAPVVRQIRIESLHEKAIVIPKGTIIAGRPVMSPKTDFGVGAYPNGAASGLGSGEIPLGVGYSGSLLTADVDDMVEGYDRLNLVAEIANGGTLAADAYTSYDTDRNRVGADGNLVSEGDLYVRPANIPIGYVPEDVFIFDAGQNLNYEEAMVEKMQSFKTRYYIEVPYIISDTNNGDEYMLATSADGVTGEQTMADGYAVMRKLGMQFLYADTLSDMINGTFVTTDLNGKLKVQYAADTAVGSGAVRDSQTVGKMLAFSNRYPTDLEDMVQTHPDTRTGGTATYGLKYRLFVTVTETLKAVNGTEPTLDEIAAAINSGKFGMANVLLSVS